MEWVFTRCCYFAAGALIVPQDSTVRALMCGIALIALGEIGPIPWKK